MSKFDNKVIDMILHNQGQSRKMIWVIFSLAWPTMLEQLLNTAVQYIDTAMVGTLGTQATAAVGATSTVNWLVSSTISAVSVGFLACIAQASGKGDHQKVKDASAQAVLAALFCGILFSVITLGFSGSVPIWMQVEPGTQKLASRYFFIMYSPTLFRSATIIFGTILRAAGDTKTPMRVGLLVNAVNVVLNYFLIYPTRPIMILGYSIVVPGMGLGVIGAAIASAIAFTTGGIAIGFALWRHPAVSPRGQSFRPNPSILRRCLMVALPNALQRFGTSFGYVVFASMINSVGDAATAAHTIANTVESAFYIPGYGMQTAAATLAGNAYGARDEKSLKTLGRTILLIETVLMILSGGMLFLLAPKMMRIFSESVPVLLGGTTVLRMVALSEPFYGVSIIVEGMLQGMGKTILPFVVNLFGMWCIRIVGTFICTQFLGFGLIAAWGCMIAHNLALFIVYSIYYFSGKWNPMGRKKKNI